MLRESINVSLEIISNIDLFSFQSLEMLEMLPESINVSLEIISNIDLFSSQSPRRTN